MHLVKLDLPEFPGFPHDEIFDAHIDGRRDRRVSKSSKSIAKRDGCMPKGSEGEAVGRVEGPQLAVVVLVVIMFFASP